MNRTTNRRRAPRLRYQVTVRFGQDADKPLAEALMVDVSSGGLAFRCDAGESCPRAGQPLVTHFSIPSSGEHDSPSMMEFTRNGRVLRVKEVNSLLCHVAVQFDEPLPVGKVFFDTIGLYRPSPAGQGGATDECVGKDEDSSVGVLVEQRIEELEHELATLRQLRDAEHLKKNRDPYRIDR